MECSSLLQLNLRFYQCTSVVRIGNALSDRNYGVLLLRHCSEAVESLLGYKVTNIISIGRQINHAPVLSAVIMPQLACKLIPTIHCSLIGYYFLINI